MDLGLYPRTRCGHWTHRPVDRWTGGQVDRWTGGQVDRWEYSRWESTNIYASFAGGAPDSRQAVSGSRPLPWPADTTRDQLVGEGGLSASAGCRLTRVNCHLTAVITEISAVKCQSSEFSLHRGSFSYNVSIICFSTTRGPAGPPQNLQDHQRTCRTTTEPAGPPQDLQDHHRTCRTTKGPAGPPPDLQDQ